MDASITARPAPQSTATTLPVLPRVLASVCALAVVAAAGTVAAQPAELLGMPAHLGTSALAALLGVGALYAASLWRGARSAVHWLEQLPRPSDSPRRRARDGRHFDRPLPNRPGLFEMLRAEFHAVAAANPTRRLEDKTAFLRRMASRCLAAAVVLVGIATALVIAV